MHCPRCGAVLEEEDGLARRCAPGAMRLSEHLTRALDDCYVKNVRAPREGRLPFRVGGTWYCPGCGVMLEEPSVGEVRCPACKRSLVEFIRHLVELHPHKDAR